MLPRISLKKLIKPYRDNYTLLRSRIFKALEEMKLVDRKTFLSLPEGTVFCKFPLNDEGNAHGMTFGMGAPCIKGESINNDFFCCTLGEEIQPKESTGSKDYFDILFDMQKNLGKEVHFELAGGRDGFFDDENVGFMVYSKEEIQEMIDELNHCLSLLSSSAPTSPSDENK